MNARSVLLIFALIMVTACTPEPGPPLSATDVRLFAALTGKNPSVGYLTLHNHSDLPLTIERISSANFATVQMHETRISDHVASMQALPSVTIEPGSSVSFEAGGKHLMLLRPTTGTAAGSAVKLEIHYDASGLLIVSTTLQNRRSAE